MSTSLTGNTHVITLEKAVEMTRLYRKEKNNILNPAHAGKDILSLYETFNRSIFDKILAQVGCVGVRIHYGMTDDLRIHAIIVGVNSEGKDILPSTTSAEEGDSVIGEEGQLCPPICQPPSSALEK